MVSPCVDSRLSSGADDLRYSATQHRSIVGKSAPPPEFQFSAGNVKVCRQPKQSHPPNGLKSDARRLGSIRASALQSGPEEFVIVRHKYKSSSSNSATSNSSKRKIAQSLKSRQNFDNDNDGDERFVSDDKHYGSQSEHERRRQMKANLNAMLGVRGPPPRKNSLTLSQPGFHEQKAPDARNNPYQVHKWRRKSSHRKYAGMQPSPTITENLVQEMENQARKAAADFSFRHQLDSVASEQFRKPHMPLPGINMLPSLHVHNRSETGASGREEVTLKFARNGAMEELERRFHEGNWKTKAVRRIKQGASYDQLPLENLIRETRRTNALRRAASLQVRQNVGLKPEDQRKTSAMPTLESLLESPEKTNRSVGFALDVITPEMEPRILDNFPSFNVVDVQRMKHQASSGNLSTPPVDAVKFKKIENVLAEETVTIISKPFQVLSPNKRSNPGHSRNSLILSDDSLHTGPVTDATTVRTSLKHSSHVSSEIAPRPSERKFPILPEFTKSQNTASHDGSVGFSHFQQTSYRQNEWQHGNNSHNSQSPGRAGNRGKARGNRATLPPLLMIDRKQNETSNNKIGKRKSNATDSELVDKKDGLPGVASSPTRKKLVTSSKTSPLSHASSGAHGAKDSYSTPVDSTGSPSTIGGRRRSNKLRRRSIRAESKGSPQFQKAWKQTKMAKLIKKWRVAIRLTIMFNRLCRGHRMISDDSYNIHFAGSGDALTEIGTKPEVLFDVTDYKTKNQQKLSDSARRILSIPTEERTEQDLRMVRTTLRNVKAIADHSALIQTNIARSGYVVGFESKRVIVLEKRRSLNFYVLLAGSAVIIKEDESGNTNPTSFMKRGDVFGENEILDNGCWEWSVVTVDPCEFLLLDKSDYMRIFLARGSGGLMNDPDRGAFLKSLPLFRGWPTQLLETNPNRCLFRYYKRGALIAKDNAESDWIFVIKSGSCSVLKPLRVEHLTTGEIYRRQLAEQTATFPHHLSTHLVEKLDVISEEEHLQKIQAVAEAMEAEQISVLTSYQKIEKATLLKELNIDLSEGMLTPVNEEDEEEDDANAKNGQRFDGNEKSIPISITEGEIDSYVATDTPNGEFRMSRVSDRAGFPRTPSPMKAAYLQTGISSPKKEESGRMWDEGNRRKGAKAAAPLPTITKTEFDEEGGKEIVITDTISADDFLSKLDTSSESDDVDPPLEDKLKPVFVNVRKLTRGCSFGMNSILFNDQPSLALVSNGAECLIVNKKFYLTNMTDEVLKNLREAEHPYPTENDLLENYWRLISWKAFQQRTMRELFRRKARVKHYLNPPKTDVF